MILRLLLGYDCPERWLLAAVAGGAVMAICTTLVLRSAPAGVIVGVITYAVVVVWRSRR